MKKTLLTLTTFCIFAISSNAQNIWRCNNDPGVTLSPNMFRTLQAAHDAASVGDIIYVEPSYNSNTYGALTCTKTLRIIGNGYDQTLNTVISQPWNKKDSEVDGSIIVKQTAPGTIFEGLYISNAQLKIEAQNVTFSRCKFYISVINNSFQLVRKNTGEDASGAIFTKCRFIGGTGLVISAEGYNEFNVGTCSYTTYQVENVTISNNIGFSGIITGYMNQGGTCAPNPNSPISVPKAKNFTITNNISYTSLSATDCQNCIVQNNIIQGNIQYNLQNVNLVAGNNICTSTCGIGSNNVNNAVLSSIFQGTGQSFEPDQAFRLKVGSPAIGSGFGGVDAGAFGTNDPYRISGLAPIPQITSYSKNAS